MKITLENFKTWEKKTFDLGNEGVTLLNGVSGRGKSSILHAILFALYGTGNKITTFGKKKTKVILEIDDMIIERQNSPKKLTVNKKFVNDEGQELINRKFSNVFDIVGYIEQKSINNFISMTPKDRLSFIEKFAFQDINLNEMKSKLKSVSTERTQELNRLKGELNMINKLMDEIKVEVIEDVSSESIKKELNELEDTIGKMVTKVNEEKMRLNDVKHNNDKYIELKETIEEKQKLLDDIEYIGDDKLDEYKKLIENYKHFQEVQKYNEYTKIINDLKKELVETEDLKKELNDLIDLQNDFETFKEIEGKIEKLNFNKKDLLDAKKQLSLIDFKYLNCPKCDVMIRFNDNDISVCDEKIIINEDKNNLKKKIKKLENDYVENKSLKSKLVEQDFENLDVDRINFIKDILTKQENIQQEIKLNERHQSKLNVENLSINSVEINYKEIVEIIQTNTTNLKMIMLYENELEKLEKSFKKLEYITEDDNIESYTNELSILKLDFENKKDIYDKVLVYEKYTKYKDEQNKLEGEISMQNKLCNSIETLKSKFSIAQNIAIDNIIETIQFGSQNYIDKFFEDPMTITISTFTDKNKPQLNINLFYKGNETTVNSLSGGEYDRLILAITLALSELFGTKLILLDEIIGSLDIESTTSIIEIIKENTNGKLVVFIAHQLVSGQFDLIVNV